MSLLTSTSLYYICDANGHWQPALVYVYNGTSWVLANNPGTNPPPTPPPPNNPGVDTLANLLNDMQAPHDFKWPGVPGFAWENGPTDGNPSPPFVNGVQCSALLPWFQISYAHNPPSSDTNTRVQVRFGESYVWNGSAWFVLQQMNLSSLFNGYEYPNDFGSGTVPVTNERDESANGGGVSFLLSKTPTSGSFGQGSINCCIHGYPNARGDLHALPFPISQIQTVRTTWQMRLILDNPNGTDDRASALYIGAAGADWWLNTSIGFNPSQANNPGVGQGREHQLPTNGSWIAEDFWTGPYPFTPSWSGSPPYPAGSISLATMQTTPPALNALGQ